jgi:hypothetical protein
VVASSFREVKARCLPFPARSAKVKDLIDWVGGEVKTVPGTMWKLNDIFVILAIKGCQELSHHRGLAASQDASVV